MNTEDSTTLDLALVGEDNKIATALEQEERSLLDRLTQIDEGLVVWERRVQAIESCRTAALRATLPEHWVLNRDRQGNVLATPSAPACARIAEYYGIQLSNLRPTDAQGGFAPVRIRQEDGTVVLRAWCDALCRFNGRMLNGIEASRQSDEQFIGRGHEEDQRKSVLTLLQSRAVRQLVAVARIPVNELDAAWESTDKTTARCVKGHGFGSSTERSASAVAEEGVEKARAELGQEILRLTGGDRDAAADVLQEITGNPDKGFKGFRSVARMTKKWQVENAKKRLRTHSLFGDDAQGGE